MVTTVRSGGATFRKMLARRNAPNCILHSDALYSVHQEGKWATFMFSHNMILWSDKARPSLSRSDQQQTVFYYPYGFFEVSQTSWTHYSYCSDLFYHKTLYGHIFNKQEIWARSFTVDPPVTKSFWGYLNNRLNKDGCDSDKIKIYFRVTNAV